MCGDELLDQAQIEAAIAEAGRRLGEILLGNVEGWAPIGFVPEAFTPVPAMFTASYTPACRLCASLGRLTCPVHGIPRRFPDPSPAWLTGGV